MLFLNPYYPHVIDLMSFNNNVRYNRAIIDVVGCAGLPSFERRHNRSSKKGPPGIATTELIHFIRAVCASPPPVASPFTPRIHGCQRFVVHDEVVDTII